MKVTVAPAQAVCGLFVVSSMIGSAIAVCVVPDGTACVPVKFEMANVESCGAQEACVCVLDDRATAVSVIFLIVIETVSGFVMVKARQR